MKDSKFNLSKGEDSPEETKSNKFNLSKGEETASVKEEKGKFNLSKGEEPASVKEEKGKFNLSKGEEPASEKEEKGKFNLTKEADEHKSDNKVQATATAATSMTSTAAGNTVDEKVVSEKTTDAKTVNDKAVETVKTEGGSSMGDKKVKSEGKHEDKSKIADNKADKGKGGTFAKDNSSASGAKEEGKKTWLWMLLVLLFLAAILVFALRSCNKDKQAGKDTPVEQVVDNPEDEIQEATESTATPGESINADNSLDNPSEAESAETTTPARSAQPSRSVAPARNAATPAQPTQMSTTPQTAAPRAATSHVTGQLTGDIEKDALAAIRGEFGNGQARKEALGAAYAEIQKRVNEIYREKYNN